MMKSRKNRAAKSRANKSRANKSRANKAQKGGRKTRKMNKKASPWNQLVMKHFRAGKAKSKAYSLRDAMMDAKKEKNSK